MSAKLQSFLAANRIRQASLARAIGVDPAAVNRALRGSRSISVAEAARILSYLSSVIGRPVEFSEVFGSDDDTAPALVVPEEARS